MKIIKLYKLLFIFVLLINTIKSVYAEPEIINIGKVLFVEIIEETRDKFNKPFEKPYYIARNLPSKAEYINGKLFISTKNNNILLNNQNKNKLVSNYWRKYMGVGRSGEYCHTKEVNELPYKYVFDYYDLKEGKDFFGLGSFHEINAVKLININILSYDSEGNLKLNIIMDSDEFNLTLKPMETWKSGLYTTFINPKEYMYKYTAKEYLPRIDKIIRKLKWDGNMLPESVMFSTKIIVKNYGLVEGEKRVFK